MSNLFHHRQEQYTSWIRTINEHENGLEAFSRGYLIYGFQVLPNSDITYREWAPGAETASLIGDFSAFPPSSRKTPLGLGFGWGKIRRGD